MILPIDDIPLDLPEAADANFVTHVSWVQQCTPGMRVIADRGLVLVDSGLACDTFNFVCRARLAPDTAVDRVRKAIAYFRQMGRPFSWWVGPADQPAELGQQLAAAGLHRAETELAMSADLAGLCNHDVSPHGLQIRRVQTATELRAFARINAANATPPDANVLHFYELAAGALLTDDAALVLYLGYLEETPVATAELAVGGGIVGLYNISTLEAHRRRGIGTAMTLRPLLDAKTRGHRTAILQAAPEGVGVYTRVGFAPFGHITEYKLLSH